MITGLIFTSWGKGELAKIMKGHVDITHYYASAKSLLNMIVRAYAVPVRKPGSRFVAETRYPDKITRCIKFVKNVFESYCIEFGEYYFRFFREKFEIDYSLDEFNYRVQKYPIEVAFNDYSIWFIDVAYTVGDRVLGRDSTSMYICTLDHTSTYDDEPGVGVNWGTYWEQRITDDKHDVGTLVWKTDIGLTTETTLDQISNKTNTVFSDGMAYVVTNTLGAIGSEETYCKIFCFDELTGEQLWVTTAEDMGMVKNEDFFNKPSFESYYPLAGLEAEHMFICGWRDGAQGTFLYKLNKYSGEVVWEKDLDLDGSFPTEHETIVVFRENLVTPANSFDLVCVGMGADNSVGSRSGVKGFNGSLPSSPSSALFFFQTINFAWSGTWVYEPDQDMIICGGDTGVYGLKATAGELVNDSVFINGDTDRFWIPDGGRVVFHEGTADVSRGVAMDEEDTFLYVGMSEADEVMQYDYDAGVQARTAWTNANKDLWGSLPKLELANATVDNSSPEGNVYVRRWNSSVPGYYQLACIKKNAGDIGVITYVAGQIVWETVFGDYNVSTNPIAKDGRVYFGTAEIQDLGFNVVVPKQVVCLDGLTGNYLWSYELENTPQNIVLKGNYIYVTTTRNEATSPDQRATIQAIRAQIDGSFLEIGHPYSEDELWEVDYAQKNDVIRFTHPLHPVGQLIRQADTEWFWENAPITGGPWEDYNETEREVKVSVKTVEVASTTCLNNGGGWFTDALIGRLLRVGGFVTDTGSVYVGQQGYVEVLSLNSDSSMNVQVIVEIVDTSYHNDYSFNAFYEGNYPARITYHESRLCLGRTPAEPQTEWFSKPYLYLDFNLTDDENFSGFSQTLNAKQSNIIEFLSSGSGLVTGTSGGEFISTSPIDGELNAGGKNASRKSGWGSEFVRVANMGAFIYYVQRGGRKVRELAYERNSDMSESDDMTLFSEHITISEIQDMDYQQNPDSCLWCVKINGDICVLTRHPAQEVMAWTPLTTQGEYKSIIFTPSFKAFIRVARDADPINLLEPALNRVVVPNINRIADTGWAIVKRGDKQYVEIFDNFAFDDTTLPEDIYPMDSRFEYNRFFDTLDNILTIPTLVTEPFYGVDGTIPAGWTETKERPDTTIGIEDNKLAMAYVSEYGSLTMLFDTTVTGDFDVRVDFSDFSWATGFTSALGLQAEFANGDFFSIRRYANAPETRNCYVASATGETSTYTDDFFIYDVSGALRLVRTGTTAGMYYWSGSAWVLIIEWTVASGDVDISFYSNETITTDQTKTVYFDNFNIIGGGVPLQTVQHMECANAFFTSLMVDKTLRIVDVNGTVVADMVIDAVQSALIISGLASADIVAGVVSGMLWAVSNDQIEIPDHLIDETVDLVIDGEDQGSITPSSSPLTLIDCYKYSMGYNFESQVIQNPLNTNTPRGTAKGKIQRVTEVALEVYASRGLEIGTDEDNTYPVQLPEGSDEAELFTGTIPNLPFDGKYDYKGEIVIKSKRPYPMNLLGIYPKVEINEGK